MQAQHAEATALPPSTPAPEQAPPASAAPAPSGGRPLNPPRAAPPPLKPATVMRDMPKVGRNDPCPCGSGKKYKQCHGQL